MNSEKKLHVAFNALLQPGDTEKTTIGCRANNPDICKNNGISEICALVREDGICYQPTKAWKKQYLKLRMEGGYDAK